MVSCPPSIQRRQTGRQPNLQLQMAAVAQHIPKAPPGGCRQVDCSRREIGGVLPATPAFLPQLQTVRAWRRTALPRDKAFAVVRDDASSHPLQAPTPLFASPQKRRLRSKGPPKRSPGGSAKNCVWRTYCLASNFPHSKTGLITDCPMPPRLPASRAIASTTPVRKFP